MRRSFVIVCFAAFLVVLFIWFQAKDLPKFIECTSPKGPSQNHEELQNTTGDGKTTSSGQWEEYPPQKSGTTGIQTTNIIRNDTIETKQLASMLTECDGVINWPKKSTLSQYGQDEEIFNRYFKNKCNGTFIEMGALDGLKFSNSYIFEKVYGWRGFCVEASPANYKKLIENRPLCVKVNAAIMNNVGTIKFLQIHGYSQGLSGILEFLPKAHLDRIFKEAVEKGSTMEVVEIQSTTVQALLAEYGTNHVDFFSLDTEGSELPILKSIDFDKVSVGVFLIENNFKTADVEQFLKTKGYKKVANAPWTQDDIYMQMQP